MKIRTLVVMLWLLDVLLLSAQSTLYTIDQELNTGSFYSHGGIIDMLGHTDGRTLITGNFSASSVCGTTTIIEENGNVVFNGINYWYGFPHNVHFQSQYLRCGVSTITIFDEIDGTNHSFQFEYQKSAYNGFLGNVALDALVEVDDRILVAGRYFTDSINSNNIASLRQLCRVDSTGIPDPDFPMLHCAEPVNAQVFRIDTLSDYEFGGYDYNHVGKLNPNFSVDTTFVNSFSEGGAGYLKFIDSQDRIWIQMEYVNDVEGNLPDGSSFIRLLPDGSIDPTFQIPQLFTPHIPPDQHGLINKVIDLGNGTFFVIGVFDAINGMQRKSIALINDDGSVVADIFENWGVDEATWGSWSQAPYLTDAELLPDGKILIGGQFSSFGGEPYSCLVRLQPQPVTTRDQIKKQGLLIYPNPATGHFTLRLPDGEDFVRNVEIFDLHGRVLRQWTAPSVFGGTYSVEGLAAGVYVVKVDTGKSRFSQKLIVRP
jgi:hypothetical protein